MRQINHRQALYSSMAYLLMNLGILHPYIEVDTINGRIRGAKTVARNGRPYIEFLNIPYARPPVGKLRFESPRLPFSWTGVQDATNYGNSCLQYEFLTHFPVGDEDCLNLNVYTHKIYDRKTSKLASDLKPVIVYFYGGLFMSGFSFVYRAKYFMEEDVVLVTMNYRANALGFLNTGDGVVRGNMGLKDQVMALRWVKSNIKFFGGDPDLVTIMGQSAGGASTHYHLLSNMSSGLFHRAISMSGTALSPWAFSKQPRTQADNLAKKVNCFFRNSTSMIDCLKMVHPHRLVREQNDYLNPLANPLSIFSPSIESVDDGDTFLSTNPRRLVLDGTFPNHVPWIAGVTNGEGLLGSTYLLKRPKEYAKLETEWNRISATTFGYNDNRNVDQISAKVRQFYFGNLATTDAKAIDGIARLYSDYLLYLGFAETVQAGLNSSKAPIYAYYFTYARDYGLANFLSEMLGGIPRFMDFGYGAVKTWFRHKTNPNSIRKYDVTHADDITLLFNIPAVGDEITPGSADYPFSAAFVKLIVSFARDGKPANMLGINWPPVSVDTNGTLRLFELSEQPKLIPLPFENSIHFWKSLNLT